MSALAEALVAAQRRAIAALEKAYVAGHIDREHAETMLRNVGAQNSVDLERRQGVRFIGRQLERFGAWLDSWSWGWR